MEDLNEEDFFDSISDISGDSTQDAIEKSKSPQGTYKSIAGKVRRLEKKILLGLLTETEEERMRKSKYFTPRFDKLLKLSNDVKKANLFNLISDISVNEKMMADLKSKAEKSSSSSSSKKKFLNKIDYCRTREKSIKKKLAEGSMSQKEQCGLLSDQFFTITFGDNLLALSHEEMYQVGFSIKILVIDR